MSQSKEFDRLEQFVGKLLTQYEQLLEKNGHLQRLLQQRENEIAELKEKVNSADSERGDISNRIKNLIDQIEEWQSAITESGDNDAGQKSGDHGPADQESAPLEEDASMVQQDDSSESDAEQEDDNQDTGPQRNQRNLFHVGPDQE